MAAAMSGYLLTFVAAEILIDKRHLAGPLAYVLAILPGLSVAAIFWALGRLLIEEKDEYLRTLLVRQILIASGITMVAASIYSFLEMYRLVQPAHGFYIVWLFFLALGVGGTINKLTYGDSGTCY
jgi:hypothetical protein